MVKKEKVPVGTLPQGRGYGLAGRRRVRENRAEIPVQFNSRSLLRAPAWKD